MPCGALSVTCVTISSSGPGRCTNRRARHYGPRNGPRQCPNQNVRIVVPSWRSRPTNCVSSPGASRNWSRWRRRAGLVPVDDALPDAVAGLLRSAADLAVGPGPRAQLDELTQRMTGPLRVAVAGKIKAGKSTLLNALVGEELAPTDAGECTHDRHLVRPRRQPRVVIHPLSGEPQ